MGGRPDRRAAGARLTRSAKGEGSPVFAPDGTLLFTSARPDPDGSEPDDETPAALWRCRPTGEARVVSARRGGFAGVVVAREAGTVVVLSDTLPGAPTARATPSGARARKDAGVDAVLHASYPVRFWDHDLGAGQNRLLAGDARRRARSRGAT